MPINQVMDETANHEVVVEPAYEGDDLLVNALFGLYTRLVCASQASKDLPNNRVTFGMIHNAQPARTKEMIALLVKYRYLELVPDQEREYNLLQHKGLVDWEPKEVIEWRNQRKRDISDPRLTMPCRYRDGDQCRYCHRVVDWANRSGKAGGTYDHINPGTPAQTAEDLRVSCNGCNAGRGNRKDADDRYPPQPVPERPYYTDRTAVALRDYGYRGVRASGESRKLPLIHLPTRPAHQADNATEKPSDPATSGTTPTTPQDASSSAQSAADAQTPLRPAHQADNARNDPEVAPKSRRSRSATSPPLEPDFRTKPPPKAPTIRNPGTGGGGREGLGLGSGQAPGQPLAHSPASKKSKRSRRGKKNSTQESKS